MFGKDSGNGGDQDNTAKQVEQIELPPLRHWRVYRYQPTDHSKVEAIDVHAHGMEYGGTLVFHTAIINPVTGQAVLAAQRGFASWLDFEEIPVPPASKLLH